MGKIGRPKKEIKKTQTSIRMFPENFDKLDLLVEHFIDESEIKSGINRSSVLELLVIERFNQLVKDGKF